MYVLYAVLHGFTDVSFENYTQPRKRCFAWKFAVTLITI